MVGRPARGVKARPLRPSGAAEYTPRIPAPTGAAVIAPPARPDRLDAIDWLRGVVMVVMALDDVRSFFLADQANPEDPAVAGLALFLTRWVTYFCAPAFVFLAGTGAFLAGARMPSRPGLARFLVTRGLWLVVLELMLVRLGWSFNLDYTFVVGQVIWAIGWSFVILAGLVWLPAWAVGVLGACLVAAAPWLAELPVEAVGMPAWLWDLLFRWRAFEPTPGVTFFNVYPVAPWFGILAAGYGCGPLFLRPRARRRRLLLAVGMALTAAFVGLRLVNVAGGNRPWVPPSGGVLAVLTFVNAAAHPPSPAFALMTLGPTLVALGFADRPPGPLARPLVTFGRVPLFFYLVHFPLIHAAAVAYASATVGRAGWLFANNPEPPPEYGLSLPGVYLMWVAVVVVLYGPCRWYAGVKRRHRGGWLRYL